MAYLSRRDALTATAAAAGGLALATPALASAAEDAELKRLWDEWKVKHARLVAAEEACKKAEDAFLIERSRECRGLMPIGVLRSRISTAGDFLSLKSVLVTQGPCLPSAMSEERPFQM